MKLNDLKKKHKFIKNKILIKTFDVTQGAINSLCYFINYNKEDHSYIKWRRNIASAHYPIIQIDSTELTQYNMTEATFKMSEGDIITFPANLTFGFDTNGSNERITLSANIVPA